MNFNISYCVLYAYYYFFLENIYNAKLSDNNLKFLFLFIKKVPFHVDKNKPGDWLNWSKNNVNP